MCAFKLNVYDALNLLDLSRKKYLQINETSIFLTLSYGSKKRYFSVLFDSVFFVDDNNNIWIHSFVYLFTSSPIMNLSVLLLYSILLILRIRKKNSQKHMQSIYCQWTLCASYSLFTYFCL